MSDTVAGRGPAYEHNGSPVTREAFYRLACDPRRSVAVEACAGAGKTWMLVSRIARALLDGAQPHEILAITFTKKAAGEMRERLQQWLAGWSRAGDEELAAALQARGIARPQAGEVAALRQLYARVLEDGRPVQIRTFHSWFAALLRSAPLAVLEQLGLPARYELLEDDSEAVARVWRRFHQAVAREPGARADYEASVAAHGRSQTLKALHAALARRVEFALADAHGAVEDAVKPFWAQFERLGGCREPHEALALPQLRDPLQRAARALGRASAPTVSAKGAQLEAALGAGELAGVLDALLTQDEAPRKFSDKLEGIEAVRQAQDTARLLLAARCQHEARLHHGRMARLARLLLREFAALKREQGWVDMNDVERAALVMLGDPVLSGWVQERLDARVRQLLIDEFQDTNPLQWQALHGWLSAYAGAGNEAPSVFIVGDPKQSIYRFRRAEPQVFRAAQDFIVEGLGGDRLSCDHTHRNAHRVLAAVNEVLGAAQQAGEFAGFRAHTTECGAAGGVYALPQLPRQPREVAPAQLQEHWRDSLTTPREEPEEQLLALECRQAAAWVAARIAGGVPPGQIMVLARRRDRLAAMEQALRALHVPTQQPEKTGLAEAPEVRDLIALLDALVSPGHDLSLAQALMSPLFSAGEAALVQLALLARAEREAGRPASWFELLQARRDGLPPLLQETAGRLAGWQLLLRQLPPHDALQAIYDEGEVLARFGCAAPAPLRPAVLANLRALLDAALQIRGGRYLTPYALVRALKTGGMAGPALSVPGVVRLLTVHGAKGLEAPLVLVLDTDGAPARAESMGVLCEWPGEAPAPWRFAFIASETRPPACSADALAVEQAARRREELNALYVAMTRAGRELVISSVQPPAGQPDSWWRRLWPLAEPLQPEQAVPRAESAASFELPVLPTLPGAPRAAGEGDPASSESRLGEAMHRLLEWGPAQGGAFSDGQCRRVAREFGLDAAQAAQAADMAARIRAGEGAWAWDPAHVDWQGDEVELHHGGELLRLDRLVRRRAGGDWWVLDYKSRARPQEDAQLVQKMRRYVSAVAAAYPGAAVRAAFLTPQGRLVAID